MENRAPEHDSEKPSCTACGRNFVEHLGHWLLAFRAFCAPWQIGVVALSLAAVILAYAAASFIYLFVYSSGNWVPGVVVGVVSRAMAGRSYYQGAGSLMGPTWPYFPLSLLLTHALAKIGLPLLILPPLLGGLSVFLLPIASACFARSLGAKWLLSLVTSFVLYCLTVPRYRSFSITAAGFDPDACVPVFSILTCVALAKIERAGPTWTRMLAFGLCLLGAGLSKQTGNAALAGSIGYLVIFSQTPWAARWKNLGVVAATGGVVLAVVFGMPHCFEVTVRVMSHHPRDWERLAVLWEHLFTNHLPGVLLCLVGLSAALTAGPEVRPRALHLGCILFIVLVLQILATVKNGGGGENDSYNMDMVVSLSLPFAAWAWATLLGRTKSVWSTAVIVVACGLCAKSVKMIDEKTWKEREASWAVPTQLAKDFARLGRQGGVFATTDDCWPLYKSGYRIDTTPTSLWHYAQADLKADHPAWLRESNGRSANSDIRSSPIAGPRPCRIR